MKVPTFIPELSILSLEVEAEILKMVDEGVLSWTMAKKLRQRLIAEKVSEMRNPT